jgi:hypothetical protein
MPFFYLHILMRSARITALGPETGQLSHHILVYDNPGDATTPLGRILGRSPFARAILWATYTHAQCKSICFSLNNGPPTIYISWYMTIRVTLQHLMVASWDVLSSCVPLYGLYVPMRSVRASVQTEKRPPHVHISCYI